METSTPTRERILAAAMRLFSENGYGGTSITQIETAAGLTRGAGGIYHHFRTKEALLAAGVERHLSRLQALRDIRHLLTGVGDLRTELTLTARYVLAELDHEQELLRVVAAEARAHPDLMRDAVDQLVRTSFAGFADLLRESAGVPTATADAISAVGLGSLLSTRLLQTLCLVNPTDVDDETFVATWVDMMERAIEAAVA